MNKVDVITKCLDNTATKENYYELGILFFAGTFFEQCRLNIAPYMHYKVLMDFLKLFDPKKTIIHERQMSITIHRGAAKTTLFSKVIPLYLTNLCGGSMLIRFDNNRIESVEIKPEFIEIFSETHKMAENFTMNIRYELESNRLLKEVFGNKNPGSLEKDEISGTWRKDCFVTKDNVIIYGNGSGEQARGTNIRGRRPTILIFDDIYSMKNTLTDTTRERIRGWFNKEALESSDIINGKALLIGTIVHEDTVLQDVKKPGSQWINYQYPVISKDELEIALKECKMDYENRIMELPSIEKLMELQNSFTTLSWPDRLSLFTILSIYQKYWTINRLSFVYQEYLNELLSPDDIKFIEKMVHFTPITVYREEGLQWIEFKWNTYTWRGLIRLNISVDPASSERQVADDTAIIVSGYAHVYPQLDGFDYLSAQDKHIHKKNGIKIPVIVNSFIGKADIYEDLENHKQGICNIVEKFCLRYKIDQIIFETMGQQGLLARELQKYLRTKNINIIVIEEKNMLNKITRIESTLLPIFQSARIVIMQDERNSYIIWSQLRHLGMSEHDDGADALSMGMLHARIPEKLDYQSKSFGGFNRENINKVKIPNWETV
jgi:hypothetical protein